MNVIKYVKERMLEKDRYNLRKTKATVKNYLDRGSPLVPAFEEKIGRFCDRYNMSRGEVLASILSDKIAATTFAKSASRQRVAEKAQLYYLKNVRRIKIERLKQSGPESVRLRKGNLEYGTSTTGDSTKSIDALGDNSDFLFVKWTDGTGGGQDNQAFDAIRFLEAATKYINKHDDDRRFVAILDGPYYAKNWRKFIEYTNSRLLVETSDTYNSKTKRKPSDNIIVEHLGV